MKDFDVFFALNQQKIIARDPKVRTLQNSTNDLKLIKNSSMSNFKNSSMIDYQRHFKNYKQINKEKLFKNVKEGIKNNLNCEANQSQSSGARGDVSKNQS